MFSLFQASLLALAAFSAPTDVPVSKGPCTVTTALLDPSTYKVDQKEMTLYYNNVVTSLLSTAASTDGSTPNIQGHVYTTAQPVVQWPVHAGVGPVIQPVKMDIAYSGSFPKSAVQSSSTVASLKREIQDLLETVINNGHFYSYIQAQCDAVLEDNKYTLIEITTKPILPF